jgi:hypothetical protein
VDLEEVIVRGVSPLIAGEIALVLDIDLRGSHQFISGQQHMAIAGPSQDAESKEMSALPCWRELANGENLANSEIG